MANKREQPEIWEVSEMSLSIPAVSDVLNVLPKLAAILQVFFFFFFHQFVVSRTNP